MSAGGRNISTMLSLLLFASLLAPSLVSAFFVPRGSLGISTISPLESATKIAIASSGIDAALMTTEETVGKSSENRVAVLICPAQFCVPVDYDTLIADIKGSASKSSVSIGTCKVAPLPRTEWIKVARNLPTRSFIDSTLPVYKTLDWYFEAMEDAISSIFAEEGVDVNLCIIGHSIGGWVARAYLGGLSGSATSVSKLAQRKCSSLITLGTPHSSPEGALVDQTRGLLKEVEEASACSPAALIEQGIDVTCVGSTSLAGKVFTADVEEFVAATSYLPLLGRLDDSVKGDGIVPTELAFMDAPARRIEIKSCEITGNLVRHAHVLPTPWNLIDGSAPSISLPKDFSWYGSPGVIDQWAQYIK